MSPCICIYISFVSFSSHKRKTQEPVNGNQRKSLPHSICNKGINLLLSGALITEKRGEGELKRQKKKEDIKERTSSLSEKKGNLENSV